jgi:hypothetical protein
MFEVFPFFCTLIDERQEPTMHLCFFSPLLNHCHTPSPSGLKGRYLGWRDGGGEEEEEEVDGSDEGCEADGNADGEEDEEEEEKAAAGEEEVEDIT